MEGLVRTVMGTGGTGMGMEMEMVLRQGWEGRRRGEREERIEGWWITTSRTMRMRIGGCGRRSPRTPGSETMRL